MYINGWGVLFGLTMVCGTLSLASGTELYIACKTRRDPDFVVPTTAAYVVERHKASLMTYVGLGTLSAGVYGMYALCTPLTLWFAASCTLLWLVYLADQYFTRVRRSSRITKEELHDDNCSSFDVQKFIRLYREEN